MSKEGFLSFFFNTVRYVWVSSALMAVLSVCILEGILYIVSFILYNIFYRICADSMYRLHCASSIWIDIIFIKTKETQELFFFTFLTRLIYTLLLFFFYFCDILYVIVLLSFLQFCCHSRKTFSCFVQGHFHNLPPSHFDLLLKIQFVELCAREFKGIVRD